MCVCGRGEGGLNTGSTGSRGVPYLALDHGVELLGKKSEVKYSGKYCSHAWGEECVKKI